MPLARENHAMELWDYARFMDELETQRENNKRAVAGALFVIIVTLYLNLRIKK